MQIRLFAGLAAAASRRRNLSQYRVWSWLRAADVAGRGWWAWDEAVTQVTAAFGWSRGHTTRILRRGSDAWWCLDRRRDGQRLVRLRSLERVAEHLFCSPERAVQVDAARLRGNAAEFHALCYEAWVSVRQRPRQGCVVSRQTLMEVWGVTAATLRQWERTAGIGVAANWAELPMPQSGEEALRYPDADNPALRWNNGELWRQMPNTYTAALRRAPCGQRERHVLRRALCRCEGAWSKSGTGDPSRRRYFHGLRGTRRGRSDVWLYVYGKSARGQGLWWGLCPTGRGARG